MNPLIDQLSTDTATVTGTMTPAAVVAIPQHFSDLIHLFHTILYMFFAFLILFAAVRAIVLFIAHLDCDLQTYLYWRFGPSVEKRLSGQVIWISGACSGIGEQLAYDLASRGSRLVLSGHLDTLQGIRDECLKRSQGKLVQDDILALPPFDIRDTDRHEEMVAAAFAHFTEVDILINNIGRSQRARFSEISVAEDREIFDINVFGQVNLTRAVLRRFTKQGHGHFVVTSSVAGKFGAPFSASYTASKHALLGYFETIRCESYSRGIRVTTICPGPVVTPLIQRSFHSASFEEEVVNSVDVHDGKLQVTRCTELMLVAIANQLLESWIALKPILWFCFTCQYFPDLSRLIMLRFLPPDRLYQMRKGRGGSNVTQNGTNRSQANGRHAPDPNNNNNIMTGNNSMETGVVHQGNHMMMATQY